MKKNKQNRVKDLRKKVVKNNALGSKKWENNAEGGKLSYN